MSNGKIDAAEIELELSGDRRSIDRLLLTGQKETQRSIADLTHQVQEMRRICEQRALVCPGIQKADPYIKRDDRRTWVMWSVGTWLINVGKQVAVPIIITLLTIKLFAG